MDRTLDEILDELAHQPPRYGHSGKDDRKTSDGGTRYNPPATSRCTVCDSVHVVHTIGCCGKG